MYAPIKKMFDIVTESNQVRFDFVSTNSDPINTDAALHYVRPRQHVDVWFRPNEVQGTVNGLLGLMDVFSLSDKARSPFGQLASDLQNLPLNQSDYSVNGLKKVG